MARRGRKRRSHNRHAQTHGNADQVEKLDNAPREDEGDDGEFLRLAHKRYHAGYERDRENISEAYYDLDFHAGLNQWDEAARRLRHDRPCLTINSLPTYTRQITGDIRQMRPAIRCVGVDDRSDPETAEAFGAVIRYIENRSKAQTSVYAAAADSQVICGVGHWRIRTEYSSPATFDQDIRLEVIEDGVSVIWDPDASDLARADARFCFVPVDMSVDAFKERYPGKLVSDFSMNYAADASPWYCNDFVRVAEYWYKKSVEHRLVLLQDGTVYDLDDPSETRRAEAEFLTEEARALGQIAREETRPVDEVWRAVISCGQVLEKPVRHPGRYIPIVPVFGNITHIGRKIVRYGAIRFARDPQRLYNYGRSAQTELTALQPKAPFIGTEKNFENYTDQWQSANRGDLPYLTYTPDHANGGQAPRREAPPVPSAALAQEIALAAEDIKRTIGIYDAGLGAASNETSGRAILARQREGDVGSFIYVDHFTYAIQQTGVILVDLIPHIYDTARTLRIAGDDGKIEELQINTPVGMAFDGMPQKVMNDLTVGAYDVVLSTGPSYTTRREEAREGMRELVQSAPGIFPVIGDLYVKAQDWPMADEMADRLLTMAPPQIQQLVAEESEEPQPPPPPPSPAEQAAMQMEMAAKEAETRTKIAQAKKAEADAEKAGLELQASVVSLQSQAVPQQMPVAEPDPRVEQVIGAVQELQQVVGALMQALQAPSVPQAPPEMEPPPYDIELPQEPPSGGFFVGPDASGEQPV